MRGYIAVAVRRRRANYWAEFLALPGCGGAGATADAALDAAGRMLDRYAAWLAGQGRSLPPPRPSSSLISATKRHGVVAAACLRPRPRAAGRTQPPPRRAQAKTEGS